MGRLKSGAGDLAVVCEEGLIWFEDMPMVVGDEPIAVGFFYFSSFYVIL